MRLPADIPFDDWLDYLFGHPPGPSGFREVDDWWDDTARPDLAVAHLTRLFGAPEVLLDRYSPEQISQGLWFLPSESGYLVRLLEPPVAWEARRRGLLAIGELYARLFALACTDHLGHLDRGPEPPGPINGVCYMWWDLFPTWGGHYGREVDDTILEVMASTLRLDSEPCRESALHGLGHWRPRHPERVTAIVDRWLATQPPISPELRQYALQARQGCVL